MPSRSSIVQALILAILFTTISASAQNAPRKIRRLANPLTAITTEQANTEADLQRLVRQYEDDLRKVMYDASWDGNPGDLFRAIAEGRAEKTSIPNGEHFMWIAFRNNGVPTARQNVEWAGGRPMDAWVVPILKGETKSTFILPAVCLNLSLLTEAPATADELRSLAFEQPKPEPPSCNVSATPNCPAKSLDIRASSNGDISVTRIEVGGRSQPLSGLRSSGAGQWSFSPIEDGTYAITATATREGVTSTCNTRVTVDCIVPKLELAGTWDPKTKLITVDSTGSVGDVTITGITLPSGSAGDVSTLMPAGDGIWTFKTKKSLPRKTGSYTYVFDGQAVLEGETDTGSARVVVPVEAAEYRWALRFGYGFIDTDGEHVLGQAVRPASRSGLPLKAQVQERTSEDIGDGNGFSLGLEYRATNLIGIELSTVFAKLDSGYMLDLDEDWGMDMDELSMTPIVLGLNFHLLDPAGPVDFYLGPVIGLVQYGSLTFTALGETVHQDFSDEFAAGVNVGIDVPFGDSRWMFSGAVQYLDVNAEVDGRSEADELEFKVDPITFKVGLGVRF